MRRGKLDRRVRFIRAEMIDDGYTEVESWEVNDEPRWHGEAVFASKKDVSDAERLRASEVQATITTRFVIRWSNWAAGLSPKDRLFCEGRTYDISGIKEVGDRRRWLEVTTSARSDLN